MSFRPGHLFLLVLAVVALIGPAPALATQALDNSAALKGVEHTKSVFLIKFDSAARTASFMKAIRATHEGLVEQGVASDVVIVFIGKAVQFLTTKPEDSIAKEYADDLESIATTAKELKALGIRMEVCGAATKRFGVDNESVLDEMTVVKNGFISLIGWQTQGYVPMTF